MKVLNLVLRKEPFDEILNGTKTSEFRMMRPWLPYLNHFKDGKPINGVDLCRLAFPIDEEDNKDTEVYIDEWEKLVEKNPEISIFHEVGGDTEVIEYDAIQFWHGYSANRRGMLVENLKGEEELRFGISQNEKGRKCIGFDYDIKRQILFPICEIEYKLGKILKKQNC